MIQWRRKKQKNKQQQQIMRNIATRIDSFETGNGIFKLHIITAGHCFLFQSTVYSHIAHFCRMIKMHMYALFNCVLHYIWFMCASIVDLVVKLKKNTHTQISLQRDSLLRLHISLSLSLSTNLFWNHLVACFCATEIILFRYKC